MLHQFCVQARPKIGKISTPGAAFNILILQIIFIKTIPHNMLILCGVLKNNIY